MAQGPDAHGGRYEQVKQTLQELRLATVCEEASCPNVGECWGSGTATVMLMGEVCTRGCRFCDVSSGVPQPLDPLEPRHLAEAVGRLGLDYLVVTSGNRDELEGARWWRCSRPALRARGAPGARRLRGTFLRWEEHRLSAITQSAPGEARVSRDAVQEAPELLALHRSVLRACLGFVALAGPGASAFILFQGAGEGSNNAVSWGLAIGTLAFPLLWLGQQRLGFRATALLFLALSAAAAFSVRLRGGMGAGPTLLNVMSIVLAALFFGARGAVAGLVANLALLALAGALVLGDVVMTPASSLWDATRPIVWVRTFVLIGFFCGAIAAAVVYVVERLELDARRLREALAREQEERARREATQRALEHSQRLEALGRLAGSIAHDFNNALTVMMGATAFAAEPDCSSEELRGALADISSAVETASQLTQQLLVFGRRDAPKPKPVALGSAVSGFARPLRRMLPPAIQLEVEAELEGSILIDQTQLEQVLLNLVANARDAITGAGRIRIALAAREVAAPPLGWPAARPGRFAVLAVADDGAGMDETVQAHVFEPFFTTKPAGRGTGLGVAIVHAVVERAGGFIELESAPGRGSEFRLLFPLLPPAAASAA